MYVFPLLALVTGFSARYTGPAVFSRLATITLVALLPVLNTVTSNKLSCFGIG